MTEASAPRQRPALRLPSQGTFQKRGAETKEKRKERKKVKKKGFREQKWEQ